MPLNVVFLPDAVVNWASITRGETPRRSTVTAVTGRSRPSNDASRAAVNVGGSGQTWYGEMRSNGSATLFR